MRHPGLDLMRVLAILLVMWEHIRYVAVQVWPHFTFHIPVDGVDVFFVLSGYLVGQNWLNYAISDSRSVLIKAWHFWIRRFWRIWPLYYLFLILNIVGVILGLLPGRFSSTIWVYFFYFQNLIKPVDLFFWESWSLCVEELFYFLLPLNFILLSIILKKIKIINIFLFSALILIILSFLYRIILPDNYHYDLWYRKMAPSRLDALGYGVTAAGILRNKDSVLSYPRWVILATVISGLCICVFTSCYSWNYNNIWLKPSMIPFGVALIMPGFLLIDYVPKILWNIISRLARWSYAAYLIHLSWVATPIYLYVSKDFTKMEALIVIILYFVITFALSRLFYTYFEKPILHWRDKNYPFGIS